MSRAIKRMLINASHPEEIRVAIVSGQRLDDLNVEHPSKEQKKSNIYLAVISRIEPSLEAIFVNYGGNRHGFLPLKEIEPSYFLTPTHDPKSDIKRILKEGQELLIQVDKEERGNKGAALTTYISLAGCYLVLMPNNPKGGGISRRIEGDDRDEMRETLNALKIPNDMSVIIRTAGLGKKPSDLQWDLDVLLQHWQAIKNAASNQSAPCLLHQESNIIIRTIRDNLKPDIKEILIDDEKVYTQAKQYMEVLRADNKNIVQHYRDNTPLFTRFQIESQIEEAYQHEIRLPSGGSIVLDRTEALTAIDINSAQSTKGQDIENTALNTNLEAATEIARQLRLRDVGGLIVIDFIDMSHIKNQREVENKLREELQIDRAKIQISRISRFGLLEMSRQRLKSSLGENTQIVCNKCSGKGSLRTIESLSLSLLRLIEEEALKQNTAEVQAQLPIELCTFLANEKRKNVIDIETRYNTKIVLIPNQYIIFPNYNITRIKSNELKSNEPNKSYNIIEAPKNVDYISSTKPAMEDQEVSIVQQFKTLPKPSLQNSKPNLLKRLWSSLFDANTGHQSAPKKSNNKPHNHDKEQRSFHNNNNNKEKRSFDKNNAANNDQRKERLPHNHRNKRRPSDNLRKHKRESNFVVENLTDNNPPQNEQRVGKHIKERQDRPNQSQNQSQNQSSNQRSNQATNQNQSQNVNQQQRSNHKVIAPTPKVAHINNDNIKDNKIDCAYDNYRVIDEQTLIQKNKVETVEITQITIEASITIEPTPKAFKKRPSITRVSNKDNLTKRSFYPKKKLKFEHEKHITDAESLDNNNNNDYDITNSVTLNNQQLEENNKS